MQTQFIEWCGAGAAPVSGEVKVKMRSGTEITLRDAAGLSWAHRGLPVDIVGYWGAAPAPTGERLSSARVLQVYNNYAGKPHQLVRTVNHLLQAGGAAGVDGASRMIEWESVRPALGLAYACLLGIDEKLPSTPERWAALQAVADVLKQEVV